MKAFITGSTSGIGYAIAQTLAENGHEVWMHGLESCDQGQALANQLALKSKAQVHYLAGDLSQSESTQKLCQEMLSQSGGVDILVNNAGMQSTAATENMSADKWAQVLAVNLTSAFLTMSACLPKMQQQQYGRIINIASVHGLVASIHKAPYVASKFGLIGLTRVVALENATQGITANCICPGWVETALIEPQIQARAEKFGGNRTEGIRDLLREKQPTLTMSQPDDIAQTVLFLCSKSAHNITGIALPVDGGWTAQ